MEIKSYLKNSNDVFNEIMGKIKEVSNNECDYEKKNILKLNLILMINYH